MTIYKTSIILCLWTQLSHSVPRGLQDGVVAGGNELNAGFKMRVTQSGLDYVETVAQKAMQDQFPRIRISDMRSDIQNGDIHLTNMRVTKYKTPEKHSVLLEPPDQVTWRTTGADISIRGDYEARQKVLLSKLHSQGDFDADAMNVDFTVSFSFFKSDDGGLSVKSRQCTANVKTLTANVHPKFSLASAFMALYKNSVVSQMRPLVANELCREARRFIDVELNKQLATMPRKLPLNQTNYGLTNARRDYADNGINEKENENDRVSKRPNSNQPNDNRNNHSTQKPYQSKRRALRDLANNLSKHLVLDYSFIKDPIVTSKYLESMNRGEISYEGQGGTPFYPPDIQEPTPLPADRMIYLTASDYVVNSLFWHSYKHGLLTFKADGDTDPQYRSLLRTTCDDDLFGICLGTVIPEVGKTFPNSQAQIVFQVVKAPAVYFKKDEKIKFVAPSHVVAYAKKDNQLKEMITADLDIEGTMRIWIEDAYVKGNASVSKFKMTMKNNNLRDFTQEKLDDFSTMAKGMFQDLANSELYKGLPLPTVEGTKLVKPVIRFFERTVRVESDVEIDEDVLTLLAVEALKNGNSKVTIDGSTPLKKH